MQGYLGQGSKPEQSLRIGVSVRVLRVLQQSMPTSPGFSGPGERHQIGHRLHDFLNIPARSPLLHTTPDPEQGPTQTGLIVDGVCQCCTSNFRQHDDVSQDNAGSGSGKDFHRPVPLGDGMRSCSAGSRFHRVDCPIPAPATPTDPQSIPIRSQGSPVSSSRSSPSWSARLLSSAMCKFGHQTSGGNKRF